MKLRKHMMLIVGGSAVVIAAAFVLFVLVRNYSRYSRVNNDLRQNLTQLERLNRRDPYPSRENVEIVQENAARLEDLTEQLLRQLQTGPAVSAMEPADFLSVLEQANSRLHDMAQSEHVSIPEGFGFGFDAYLAGNLPRDEHVPRLATQLQDVEAIFELAVNSGIRHLSALEREPFDGRGRDRDRDEPDERRLTRARRDREPSRDVREVRRDESDLYRVENYRLEVSGRENAILDLLRTLAGSELFITVSGVQLETRQVDEIAARRTRRPAFAAREMDAEMEMDGEMEMAGADRRRTRDARERRVLDDGRPLPHEERVVSGREEVLASLNLKVYHFEDFAQE